MDNMHQHDLEQLEKLKLIAEIEEIKRPLWKKISFISVIGTLLLTFAAVVVSVWQLKESKIETLKAEKETLRQRSEDLKMRESVTTTLYNEAMAEKALAQTEKAAALSEKAEAIKQISNWELQQREQDLKLSIKKLITVNNELKKNSDNYKRGFLEGYLRNNPTVKADIARFSTNENREDFEKWLREQLLWTALKRYEVYILSKKEEALEPFLSSTAH